jgi:hypothetical protein
MMFDVKLGTSGWSVVGGTFSITMHLHLHSEAEYAISRRLMILFSTAFC